jgi:fatty-acyl-CoA synthase
VIDETAPDHALRYWAAHQPDKRLIVYEGDAVSFGEVDEWVDRVAAHLRDAGVRPGERVGVVGDNNLEWCIAAFATLRVGAILAALGERLTAEEVHRLTMHTGTRTIVASESHMGLVNDVSAKGPSLRVLPFADVARLRRARKVPFDRPEVDADDVAVIVYTSGSTGMPKGVMLSNTKLLSIFHEWAIMEPALGHEARILSVLPLDPMGGFINTVLRAAVVGGTVFRQQGKFDPDGALKLLVEERCSSLMAVPLIFQMISAVPGFEEADLSALSYAIIGGAPVPLDEFDKWFARGASLRQTYGSTEGGGHYSAMPIEGARENPERCGRGGMYRSVRIVRPDGSLCGPHEDGEILVRGPGVMMGYWNDPEATAEVLLEDGTLRTGDLGQADENGFFKVTDRIKEVIISGGYNIGPTEVETAILSHDAVEEAVVVAVPDDRFGETPGAVLRLRTPTPIDDIISHCNERLANYKVPRYILVIDEPLPRTEQGKYPRAEIKRAYGQRLAASSKVR